MESALYVVATPIGNLGDMVPRAVEILQSVNVIAAEDTRHSVRLLDHFHISTPMVAYHDHSDESRVRQLLTRLQNGESVALISDAVRRWFLTRVIVWCARRGSWALEWCLFPAPVH